ncbi:hypothetical protein GUITHDRAFT_140630 [Guillardia theta CCMP2712]|uniref:PH domain-containing protein n=1 Tax=Guillardia theta (strain CCMP2712) TaxID=905079 RepID=L1J478_GUITC|nr:hypothetical protein GUITHDRAFT_140630 [Guillardia theta CCMP2712]EKX43323.1 hypothetical protein GUITHDRAFT_140630 [Guillardia theta CCMP2712]|eukprot:XP_005830303.1 hypothetical protein GUITHDRAFT_140630 [Guillardia theta CCMP2712]
MERTRANKQENDIKEHRLGSFKKPVVLEGKAKERLQMKATEVKALCMKRCGWLMKSGLTNTHMQKRWCAIYELKLFYYESPRSEIPNGIIDLRGAMIKKCSKPKFAFEIETGEERERGKRGLK